MEIFQDKIGQGSGTSSGWLRKSLITVQFAVGILLIGGTIVILSQINYMKNLPLGFDKRDANYLGEFTTFNYIRRLLLYLFFASFLYSFDKYCEPKI